MVLALWLFCVLVGEGEVVSVRFQQSTQQ